MVKVKESDKVIMFTNPKEQAEMLLKWDLVSNAYVMSKKYLGDEKKFKYYYSCSNTPHKCDIVGYIMYPNNNGETAVVSVNNDLLKIMPAHIKEMQLSSYIDYSKNNDLNTTPNNISNNEFISIDFETANNKRESVCQVALIYFRDGQIVDEKSWLVKPPREYDYFNPLNIQIHGIKPDDIANEKEFNELWHEIKPLIEGRMIVAHNAPFDISVLRSLIDYYGLDCASFDFICTCNVARKTWDNQINYTLKNIANYLGYIFKHHDAHDDARVCGKILLDAMRYHNCNTIEELADKIDMQIGHVNKDYYQTCSIYNPYQGLGGKNNQVKILNLKPSTDASFNENNLFYNKHVCVTGTLVSMTRTNALQKIVDIGGIADNSVNQNTNYLIMGLQDYLSFADGKESSKTKKAKELISEGQNLQIISEDDFLKMLYEGDEHECEFSV